MLFSSLEFLYLYLPIVLLVYFVSPVKWRNLILFAVSIVFYGWDEYSYVFLMLFTIIVDYIAGYLIENYRENRKRQKGVLIGTVVINLGLLFVFKYAGFVLDTLRLIPALSGLPTLSLTLPIGISFYTFQAMSYVIDVYRREVSAQKNLINFGAYVTLFPQLIAGPIVRYRDIDEQLTSRRHSVALAVSGVRTFACGLAKKLLLANTAGEIWTSFAKLDPSQMTVVGAWLGLVVFGFQVYFDFSGYSDMAIGLGKIFGFKFLENFNYPYISRSVTEFWRRWHISLSSWFREYVYIPLGGNRVSRGRNYFNIFTVWLLTGLWHGASWNYVFWGLYFCLLLIIEKAFLYKWLEKIPKVFSHIYAFFAINVSWFIFVFDSSAPYLDGSSALFYFKAMFGAGVDFISRTNMYDIYRYGVVLGIMIFASFPIARRLFYKNLEKHSSLEYAANALSVLSILLCTAYLVNSGYNPFLYFRF